MGQSMADHRPAQRSEASPVPASTWHAWVVSGPGLVLDFDGTILDTERPLFQAWSEVWDAHGHRLALADWQQNIGTEDTFDPRHELERRLGRALDPERQRPPQGSSGSDPGPVSATGRRGAVARRGTRLGRPGRRRLVLAPGLGGGPPDQTRVARLLLLPGVHRRRGFRPSPLPPRTGWRVNGSAPTRGDRWRWRTHPTGWPQPWPPACSRWRYRTG